MRHIIALSAGAALAASIFTSASFPIARADGGVSLSGGGLASFDFFPGGTIFSVQAEIDAAGNVKGHFFCAIPGIVTVNGDDLMEATINADGSVTLAGLAHGFDAAVGVYFDMPFEVRLWGGGPGVGRFIYDDPVVGTVIVDTDLEGDHETVESGHIMIKS